jgi:Xaa-Pro aminopeptidase
MQEQNLKAYIIPSEDEHQSEYTANYDKKREWISGKEQGIYFF